jgi:type II secretion system protein N
LDATLEGVDLARYPLWRTWFDGAVRGRVDGTVSVVGDARSPAAAGTIALKVPGFALEGIKVNGYGVPDLHFSDVHLDGTVKNGRLEVTELVGRGQEVDVTGEGNVLLREPIEASVLSLDVTVTPVAGAPKGYDVVVGMLPGTSGAGGARRMNVIGTLARPKLR